MFHHYHHHPAYMLHIGMPLLIMGGLGLFPSGPSSDWKLS